MASWIVHLRIAENLFGVIPDLEAGSFAVGSIAPDSGIPDEKRENFTPPTQECFSEQFAADKDFIWEAKKDWYGLDFIYLRDHPQCLFWRVFLDAKPDSGDLDFLPLEAVRQRVAYIRDYYQRIDENIQELYRRPYVYLSKTEMNTFVGKATQLLYRIYAHLWIQGASADSFHSALDLYAGNHERDWRKLEKP